MQNNGDMAACDNCILSPNSLVRQVHRQGEDIGVVVLSRDGMQGLEVSQL